MFNFLNIASRDGCILYSDRSCHYYNSNYNAMWKFKSQLIFIMPEV